MCRKVLGYLEVIIKITVGLNVDFGITIVCMVGYSHRNNGRLNQRC